MTLDEIQTKWVDYDRKLDVALRLNRRLLNERSLTGARTLLRRQIMMAVAGAIAAWIMVPLMALFIASNYESSKFLIPAIVIDAYFIINMLVHIHQARMLWKIDYASPITAIQKQIDAVVRLRVRFAQWIAMTMILIWVPIAIVGFKGLFGWDLYARAPGWLLANALLGALSIVLVAWISRQTAASSESPRVQWLVRGIAGSNLTAAKEFLATLTDFEKESDRE